MSELEDAIEVMAEETFRLHRYMTDDLENLSAHRQVIMLMRKQMPNAYSALLALLGAVDKVKAEEFYERHPDKRPTVAGGG